MITGDGGKRLKLENLPAEYWVKGPYQRDAVIEFYGEGVYTLNYEGVYKKSFKGAKGLQIKIIKLGESITQRSDVRDRGQGSEYSYLK